MSIKNKIFGLLIVCSFSIAVQGQSYQQSAGNLAAREQFQDIKFGMFIHWGLSSTLGAGEWVMNNRSINRKNYTRLLQVFNPVQFDATRGGAAAKMY